MSFLDTISNTISSIAEQASEALGIKSNKGSTTARESSTHILSMPEKSKTDTFNKSNPQQNVQRNSQTKTPQQSKSKSTGSTKKQNPKVESYSKEIKQIHSRIKKLCEENGLNAKDVINNLKNTCGINKKDYKKLSEKEKIKLWRGVETIINEQIQIMKKYGTSAEASQEALLLQMAETYVEAQETGDVQDGKTFFDEAGDINEELGHDFNKKTKAEQKEKINESYNRWKQYRKQKVDEAIRNCKSEKEKAAVIKEINKHLDQMELIRYGQFLTVQDSENAYRGIPLMGPKNMGKGLKMYRATRKDDAERRRVANEIITFDSELDIIETYRARGEKADADAVKEFNQYGVMDKSAAKIQEFQDDYVKARKSGNYTYLEEDVIFTAMATGIGIGATVNTCMTEDEKAAFLHNWDIDAQQFSDYETVKQGVEEGVQAYIAEHAEDRPGLREDVERVYEKEKALPEGKVAITTSNKSDSGIYNTEKNVTDKAEKSNTIQYVTKPAKNVYCEESEYKKETKENANIKKKNVNPKVIEYCIKHESYSEAIKKYDESDVVAVILKENLKEYYPIVKSYINNCTFSQLKNIANNCSTTAYLFVLRNISPDKASKLYDIKDDLCYAARTLGEKIIEESGNNYEVA